MFGSEERLKRMRDHEFRELLDLIMCCDPWPVREDQYNEEVIKDMLLRESVKRNFTNWIDAYHNFEVPTDGKD